MKIRIVGATGTIGGFVKAALSERHEIVKAGSKSGGVLSQDPIRFGVGASLVNGAIDSFVRTAAIEMPRGIRINSTSPGVLEESLPSYGPYFLGHEAVPGKPVANAYVKSVEGLLTGQIIHVL